MLVSFALEYRDQGKNWQCDKCVWSGALFGGDVATFRPNIYIFERLIEWFPIQSGVVCFVHRYIIVDRLAFAMSIVVLHLFINWTR